MKQDKPNPKSHWSFDGKTHKVSKRNNKGKEQRWKRLHRGDTSIHKALSEREIAIKRIAKEYDCTLAQAGRVLDLLS